MALLVMLAIWLVLELIDDYNSSMWTYYTRECRDHLLYVAASLNMAIILLRKRLKI